MDKVKKNDDGLMKLLDVHTIRRLICNTNKGVLELQIRKGDANYHLILDSVPLEKEIEDKVMDLLFKIEIPQVQKEPTKKLIKDFTKDTKKNDEKY